MEKITFTQFLVEEQQILEAVKKKEKKIPKPKPRPKKTLWFTNPELWHADLQFAHGGKFQYHHNDVEEQEESNRHIFAVDPNTNACYGVWQGPKKRGVTFHTPRPLHALKHARMNIRDMKYRNPKATNIV